MLNADCGMRSSLSPQGRGQGEENSEIRNPKSEIELCCSIHTEER